MRKSLFTFLLAGVAALVALPVQAETPALTYTPEMRNPVPIPEAEKGLQTIVAEPYFKVSDKGLQLEGASFDRQGNLLFVDVFGGALYKLTPGKVLSVLVPPNNRGPGGIAIHKDGRLFVGDLGDFKGGAGGVVAFKPDGSTMQTIISPKKGFEVDDLVFDKEGGFYFTDFRGTATDGVGGLYYMAPDMKTITPILKGLHVANGVGLSPDGKTLYVDEVLGGTLYRVRLADATHVEPFGTETVYRFTGSLGPDSLRVDADGNVYVAIYDQGRYMVFNKSGFPIAQILLPGRENGHNLRSTSLAIQPGTNDLFLVSNDGNGGEGATVYHAKGLGKALTLYSHQ